MTTPPTDAREWVSFDDEEEERTWRFDLTFLESRWTCIFGAGCQGVLTEAAPDLVQGCCSYGAHMVDEEDVAKVLSKVPLLTAEDWQFIDDAPAELIGPNEDGDVTTALVDDACVFLNRPGFSGGPGCAFHVAAARLGESYVGWKPEVCWQVPIRREDDVTDDGRVISSIGQWERKHWGEGGEEFHWWCSEDPAAYVGEVRVVDSMRDELVEMAGRRTYERLLAFVNERAASITKGVPLAHPTVRSTAPRS